MTFTIDTQTFAFIAGVACGIGLSVGAFYAALFYYAGK